MKNCLKLDVFKGKLFIKIFSQFKPIEKEYAISIFKNIACCFVTNCKLQM